jgi:hypothetical protein
MGLEQIPGATNPRTDFGAPPAGGLWTDGAAVRCSVGPVSAICILRYAPEALNVLCGSVGEPYVSFVDETAVRAQLVRVVMGSESASRGGRMKIGKLVLIGGIDIHRP